MNNAILAATHAVVFVVGFAAGIGIVAQRVVWAVADRRRRCSERSTG